MEMIRKAVLLAAAMLPAIGAAQAGDYDWEDIFAPYRQRIDTATTSSGNAQNVNAATHVITPWPPYVRNRRIPGNGARMVGAIKRYQEPTPDAKPAGGAGAALLENLLKPAAQAGGGGQQSGGGNASVSAPSGQ
jgi:hypothetical protein